jgi:hypothetical protein
MSDSVRDEFDIRTASSRDIERAMRRAAAEALSLHKRAGNPVAVWDWETGQVALVPPDQIPDDPNRADGVENASSGGAA